MKKINLKKAMVLFSVYVVLTLSPAQMVLAQEYCRELDIAPGPSEGDTLIEYCSYPVQFKETGKWGYFAYVYLPKGKEVELRIDKGPQLELENLQDPGVASHTTGSDEIKIFESGAFLLFSGTSTEEMKLSSRDKDVYVSGTEECKALIQEKFITEQLIELEAEHKSDPIAMKLAIINDMLGLMGIYAMAITGAPPGGGSACDLGNPGSGGERGEKPPNPCTSGGSEIEYPSFEIVKTLEKTDTVTRWIIRVKQGALAGQEFIYESVKQPAAMETNAAYFTDKIYKLDGTKIAYRQYNYGYIPHRGASSFMVLYDDVFKEFQGKGLAKILNEYAFSKMLEAGMTSIETGPMMASDKGANPFIAKTYKNMKFGPKWNIIDTIKQAEEFVIEIKDSEYFFDSKGRPYQYADIKVKGSDGAEIGDFFLFLEDEEGKFLEGPEGAAVYNNLLKSTEEVRTFLIDQETKGRTLWGKVSWEAKDMDYLRTSILNKIKWVGGKCPGKLAYYPAGGGDVSVFKLTDISEVVIVDSSEGLSTPLAVEGLIMGAAVNYNMKIRNLESVAIESDKFQITFDYLNEKTGAWEPKEIIFYNRDANTFFPPELKGGYDLYFERWFVDSYHMDPATKMQVISNLKKGGIYLVAGRNDKIDPGKNPEPAPSLIGLEEITRDYVLEDSYQGEIPFQLCVKVEELPEDLLVDIFKNKIPMWAKRVYDARAGRAGSTLPVNLKSFDFRLNKLREGMELIKDTHPEYLESITNKLDDYLIKGFDKGDMNSVLSDADKESLLETTDQKFCDFAKNFRFFGMCGSGGCYRLGRFVSDKSYYNMVNSAGETKNLLDMLKEFIDLAKEDFGVDITVSLGGSINYFRLTSEDKPVFSRLKDIDIIVHPKKTPRPPSLTQVPGEFKQILKRNGFKIGGTEARPTFTLYEKGKPHTLSIDVQSADPVVDLIRITDLRKRAYPDAFTIVVKDPETIKKIDNAFKEHPDTPEIRGSQKGRMLVRASDFVTAGKLDKAAKRATFAAKIPGTSEGDAVADEIITRFDEGTIDEEFIKEKIEEINLLEPSTDLILQDSYMAKVRYMRTINDYIPELDDATNNLNALKAGRIITSLDALKVEVKDDTVLTKRHKRFVLKRISELKEVASKVKTALESAPDLDALDDDAVKEKVGKAKTDLIRVDGKLTEETALLYEEVGQELIKSKKEFDNKLSKEEKARWNDILKDEKGHLMIDLEIFVDFTNNLREKWYQSRYYRRVYEAMEWTHEKLGKLGKDRLATLGKAAGVAAVGIGIIHILAKDVGEKLQVIGDNENNPFYVMVGRRLETLAKWIHAGFIAMIAVQILIALVKGGLLAAVISSAVWLVLFGIIALVITTGLKYFWCGYLNKSLAGDSICMMFYGPAPIAMTATIQGKSGTCTMAGAWRGQSEMNCN